MEYGLRRYEATQRLLWFLFFLVCLILAWLMVPDQLPAPQSGAPAVRSVQPEVLKSLRFWLNLHWVSMEPFGRGMLFIIWALSIFLTGRSLGLIVQYAGQFLVKNLLDTHLGADARARRSAATHAAAASNSPATILLQRAANPFLHWIFHPFRRFLVLLTNPGVPLASERLAEKERRLAEMDWEILYSSWTPFRWLLRLLPLVGAVQTVWLLNLYLQPALSGQKDFQELFGLIFNGLFPLLQVIFLTVAFSLASGLLKRLESFYLSGVDALFYDRFLTRLPFQSSDTPVLLETLQKNFQELNAKLQYLEGFIVPRNEAETKRRS